MWYTKFGPSGDIVLSTRVRLARNFANIPFGQNMSREDYMSIKDTCKNALPDLKLVDLSALPQTDRTALCECHIISPELAAKDNGAILVNDDCSTSIMIGEEDHIRIQVLEPGFSLDKCLMRANELDDRLESKIDFAFDSQFGYLTTCPTNVGTGLRASVMMHLPALCEKGLIGSIAHSLSKLGLCIRGIYGEGSKALGNIFQISNQVTLGVSEEETIEKLEQIITELINKERTASLSVYNQNKFSLEDRIMRSKGILQNARIMSSEEAMSLLSDLRWGINLGIVDCINHEQLSSALYSTLPGSITKTYNLSTPQERDLKRAEIFREAFK